MAFLASRCFFHKLQTACKRYSNATLKPQKPIALFPKHERLNSDMPGIQLSNQLEEAPSWIGDLHHQSGSTKCHSVAESKPMLVEIERKFRIGEDTRQKLVEAGAKLVEEETFTDTYLDTSDYTLTSNDNWLRLRDSKWQLKYPSPLKLSKNTCEYVEVGNEAQVLQILIEKLESHVTELSQESQSLIPNCHSRLTPTGQSDPSVTTDESKPLALTDIRTAILHDFCTIKTSRQKFSLDDVTIDLDSADFGFAVGEIEVLVEKNGDGTLDGEQHEKALKSIDEVASKIGIEFSSDRLHGKVATFLKRFKKEHYELLVSSGVVSSI